MTRVACALLALSLGVSGCHETLDLAARRDGGTPTCRPTGAPCSYRSDCCGGACNAARCQDHSRGDASSLGESEASSPRMCVAACTTHAQCGSSCPPNPRGASCCDTLGGVCYAAMTATCPMLVDEDTGMTATSM